MIIPTRSLLEITRDQKLAEHLADSIDTKDKASFKMKDRASRKAKRLNRDGEELLKYAQSGTIADPHIIRLI